MATGSKLFLLILLLVTLSCILVLQVSLDGWIPRARFGLHQIGFIDQKKERIPVNVLRVPIEAINISNSKEPNKTTMHLERQALSSVNTTKNFGRNYSTQLTTSRPRPPPPAKVQVRQLQVSKRKHSLRRISPQLLVGRQAKLLEVMNRNEMAKMLSKAITAVQAMPAVKPEKVIRVFLITYFRSGSSFVGELLQQNWKTFYQFEPLHYMTYGGRISDTRTREAFELFRGIYHCNFTNLDNYFKWVRGKRNQFLFSRSLFLWFSCRGRPAICFDPRFVSTVCSRAPIQVVKVTRLHMSQLKTFLQENPDLNIKVVYLSRDPRGIVSSRWTMDWCNGTECSDPGVLCKEMEEDMAVFRELKNSEPSKFIQVRYEDMALDPRNEAVRLFNFLQLPFSSSVQRYLTSHSVARKTDNLNPYSTRRNSSSMAFSWRHRFTFEKVNAVQYSCSRVINMLNFSLITSPEQLGMGSKSFNSSQNNDFGLSKSASFPKSRDELLHNRYPFLNKNPKNNSRLNQKFIAGQHYRTASAENFLNQKFKSFSPVELSLNRTRDEVINKGTFYNVTGQGKNSSIGLVHR